MNRRVRRESVSEQQSLVAFLRKLFGEFKFYQELQPGLQAQVLDIITLAEYQENEIIFAQGDDADMCYIILSGEVEIWRKSNDPAQSHHDDPSRSTQFANMSKRGASRVADKMCSAIHAMLCCDPCRNSDERESRMVDDMSSLGERIAVLPPGIMFGEIALLEDAPRSATAICGDDCAFLAIQKADFDKIVKEEMKNARRKALSQLARPLLINFPFYKELHPEVQDAVPEILHYKAKKKGNILFRQNDPPGNCYIILKGEVAIWKDIEQPTMQRSQSAVTPDEPYRSENPKSPGRDIPPSPGRGLPSSPRRGLPLSPGRATPSSPGSPGTTRGANRLRVTGEEFRRNSGVTEAIGPRRVSQQNGTAVAQALNGDFVKMLKEADADSVQDDISSSADCDDCDLGIHLAILENGVLFGEQSLLNDQPRNASASCLEDCEFLVITKTDFQSVLKKVMQRGDRILPQLVLPLLDEFPLFQSLPSEVRGNLPYVVQHVEKKRGTMLFWQGDPPGDCYIVLSGAVDVFADSVDDSITWSSTKIRTTFGNEKVREVCTNLAMRLGTPATQPSIGKFKLAASNMSRVLKKSKTKVALAASQRAYGLNIGVLGQGIIFGRRGTAAESQDVTVTCAEDCQFLMIRKQDFDSLLKQELKTVKVRQHELQVRRLLQEFAIFSRFAPSVLARIPSAVSYYSASRGEALYYEGDDPGPCYIILAGKVMVWKRITCMRGSLFGPDDVVCKCCGAKRPQAPLSCECGSVLMDDAKFCRKCGKPRPMGDQRVAPCPECALPVPVGEMDDHRVQHINDRKNILFHPETGNVDILRDLEFVPRSWHPNHHEEPTAELKDPTAAAFAFQDLAALFKIYPVGADIVRTRARKNHCHKGGHSHLPEQKKWNEELVHNRQYHIWEQLVAAGVPGNLIRNRVEDGHDSKIYVHMHLVEKSAPKLMPVEKASAAAFRKCEALANMLAEIPCEVSHCECGNVFSDDSLFCRLCGSARKGDVATQDLLVPEGCIPTMTLGHGAILGQLALVEDSPREATVICTRDCEFLRIDSAELAEFQRIELEKLENQKQQNLEFFYKHLPLLQNLPETTALAAVDHFEKHEFPLHHVFFRQDEHGDGAYYLILNGSVELFVADTPQYFDNTHLPHKGFRRLGMLLMGSLFASHGPKGKEPFTAVVASSPCVVWRLGRGNFKHVPEAILKALHELSDQNTLWRMSRVGSLPLLEASGSCASQGNDYRPHTTIKGPPLGLRLNWNTKPSPGVRSPYNAQTASNWTGSLPSPSSTQRLSRHPNGARTMGSWNKLKLTKRDPFLPPEPEYVEFVLAPGACLALNGLRPKKRTRKLNLTKSTSLPSLR